MDSPLVRSLDAWRFRNRVPDAPMFMTALSRYRHFDPARVSLADGDEMLLVRRSRNPDDPNAIEVMRPGRDATIGFLPREVSAVLAPVIDQGGEARAHFHSETDVSGGMIVISGKELGPACEQLRSMAEEADTRLSLVVKPLTEDLNVSWYDQNAALYSQNADRCNPRHDLAAFLSGLRPGAKILDAGCGNGRDVERMLAMGYEVHAFDASSEMCRLTEERTNGAVRPRLLRFSEYEDPPGSWDGIWAMASLVHTPADELEDVIGRLRRSIRGGGVLFASLKCGDESEVHKDGRRMMRVTEERLRAAFPDLENTMVSRRPALNSNGVMDDWLNVIHVRSPDLELRPEF